MVRAIAPDIDCASILPGYDFADAYRVAVPPGMDAPALTDQVFARGPGWIRMLLKLRNAVVAPLGLRTAASGGFPVLRRLPQEVWLGFDDRHLDFRIVVMVAPGDATVTTIVRCHNLWGRIYLAVVKPFHRVIVPSMVGRVAAAPGKAARSA